MTNETFITVKLTVGELEQIIEVLNQQHDAISIGGGNSETIPELQVINRLCNRLTELCEERGYRQELADDLRKGIDMLPPKGRRQQHEEISI